MPRTPVAPRSGSLSSTRSLGRAGRCWDSLTYDCTSLLALAGIRVGWMESKADDSERDCGLGSSIYSSKGESDGEDNRGGAVANSENQLPLMQAAMSSQHRP
ncbi:hypothetical protein MIND_01422500 [Mycena indigotica]|uniref:Uncharacterized protein n=1 Tax=Mycena indigotica TaxID=2126181 RepID=A0A8H6RWT8_9AGAR|nr:uncharacterized protein MIND_01422500 [Mycena indigotica]KAF7288769.1 hypothetical protein MIND_01422500 [Mycena indigotica]